MSAKKISLFNSVIDVYNQKYNVVISDNIYKGLKRSGIWKEFSKNQNKDKLKEEAKTWDGMFTYLEESDFYVILIEWGTTPDVIAHECFHLICRVFREKGIHLYEETEEAYAYILDYLIRNVMGMQAKANKERNKLIKDGRKN